MIKRTASGIEAHSRHAENSTERREDDFGKLREALGAGVAAMRDPAIEEKVEAYFRDNPNFSRDVIHVAAVATRFQREGRALCRIG